MQVEILVPISGLPSPENGARSAFGFNEGQRVDIPKPLAEKWVAAGIAKSLEPVEVAPEPTLAPERAILPKPEMAVSPKGRRGRRTK